MILHKRKERPWWSCCQQPFAFARKKPTIQERFDEFHRENPNVYRLLVNYSRAAIQAGRKTLGIKAVWERMRWHVYIELKQKEEGFKLNDHFTSRYARLIMEQEPDLADFFEIRRLRSE